jgi:hypothetical protein
LYDHDAHIKSDANGERHAEAVGRMAVPNTAVSMGMFVMVFHGGGQLFRSSLVSGLPIEVGWTGCVG